ncbi:U4/U6-U5 snRNP complex subunit lsm6 [Ascosphaera pollenicola]|nr:U4/U6-U5 snRNP complex subunit lsm6 [Ascosphaera pollenicola]
MADRRLFSYPIEEGAVPFTASLPKDDVWNRMRSLSHIANSEAEEQKRLRDRVYEILNDKDAVNDEGLVDIHGNTFIAWTQAV